MSATVLKELGVTATQHGMTVAQRHVLNKILEEGWDRLHHGDCVGGDAQAATDGHAKGIYIVRHPPIDPKKRAYSFFDEDREPKEYLERNHDIANEASELVGFPRGFKPQMRSGTWATIRYALKQGKRVRIVYPNGAVEEVGVAYPVG